MEQDIILNRLLDKYENSKHLTQPNTSNRRVMLRTEKKELPEYHYETASIRDRYNQAAQELEGRELIRIEWVAGRPVMHCLVLNLDKVQTAYAVAGRCHPLETAQKYETMILDSLSAVKTPWIVQWREELYQQIHETWKLPIFFRQGESFGEELLKAFVLYDSLHGNSITMRAFSALCYQDTKHFEKVVREQFISIATKYCPELSEACDHQELNVREKLSILGIYARPELYEMAGKFSIIVDQKAVDFSPFCKTGIAIPSTAVNGITAFDLGEIKKIIFIENKTNYDEYLLSEANEEQLVVYHGGFFSPQKRVLLTKLASAAADAIQTFFWADIDLGGFQMFTRLQSIFPTLKPMRMFPSDVEHFADKGLKRSQEYMKQLRQAQYLNQYPLFCETIEALLRHNVTIEQEIFLTQATELNRVYTLPNKQGVIQ